MSFQQGLSGLSAAAKNLEVIGNNISNANTIGAKSSRAEFSDLYATAVGGGGSVGIGTSLAAVTQDHTQGSITTTGSNLDLAINGSGYFQVREPAGTDGAETTVDVLYSRNGQFKSDKDGYIVNNAGLRLLGYPADDTGNIRRGQLSEFRVPDSRLPQKLTTEVNVDFNLNAADTVRSAAEFDQADGASFNYSASVKVFDEGGQAVELGYYFRKSAPNEWEVYVTANGANVPAVAAGSPPTALGTIEFPNADGSGPPDPAALTITGADLAATLNTADSTAAGLNYVFSDIDLDLTGATQRAGDYAITTVTQDGYGVGTLNGFSFDKDGILTARYTNGESRQTGQLALASFRNPQGLQPTGGNSWMESRDSGVKSIDVPGSGNLGEIVSGALEESNVDLTAELVNLITAQRTYQANAQTIKTQDQVTQTFLNMR
jgi:flagellar hook protein FlgE